MLVPTPLRLISVDGRAFGRDRAAVSKLISTAGADVACVHGGPHLLRWRSISAALGRRAGMVVVTGGRPAGANLVLSTLAVDVRAVADIRLDDSRLNPAGAALAALSLRGSEFVLVSATLIGNSAERLGQVRALQKAIDELVPGDLPAIISAEGADRPGTSAWQALLENRVSVPGQLFVDGRIAVERASESPGRALTQPGAMVELVL